MERKFLAHRPTAVIVEDIRRAQDEVNRKMSGNTPSWALVPDRLANDFVAMNPACTAEPQGDGTTMIKWGNDENKIRRQCSRDGSIEA